MPIPVVACIGRNRKLSDLSRFHDVEVFHDPKQHLSLLVGLDGREANLPGEDGKQGPLMVQHPIAIYEGEECERLAQTDMRRIAQAIASRKSLVDLPNGCPVGEQIGNLHGEPAEQKPKKKVVARLAIGKTPVGELSALYGQTIERIDVTKDGEIVIISEGEAR